MAKTLKGVVVSNKTDKTIVVAVHTQKTHPIYKKQYPVTNKFMAHDEENTAKEGDTVMIIETRPLSKRKRFVLTEVVSRAALTSEDKTALIAKEDEKTDEVAA
jgi:small subunit ribosomal protein S17